MSNCSMFDNKDFHRTWSAL